MSRIALQKRMWLMSLTLKTRPLKFYEMGMSYTFLTSSEASPLWHSLCAFAVQCYIADSLLQYVIFFMSSRSAAREVTYPAAEQTCWQGNTLVVSCRKSQGYHITQHDSGTYVTRPHRKVCFLHVIQQTSAHSPLNVLMCRNTEPGIQIRDLHIGVKDFNMQDNHLEALSLYTRF